MTTQFIKRHLAGLVVAIACFAVGSTVVKLQRYFARHPRSTTEAKIIPKAIPDSESLTFEYTGIDDMFMVTYLASDHEIIEYGCFDRASANEALKYLPLERSESTLVEHRSVSNDGGVKIGERVVWIGNTKAETRATVEWTEGARTFSIIAPSLKYALAFESSRVWVNQGCFDLSR